MNDVSDVQIDGDEPVLGRPKPIAREWLWKPWYAKLWWLAIIIYWSAFLLLWRLHAFLDFYRSTLAEYLNLAFHPVTTLVVLGVGFAKAYFSTSEWEWDELTREQAFSKRSVGGIRDPHSDPLDPRSGMIHWRNFHRRR